MPVSVRLDGQEVLVGSTRVAARVLSFLDECFADVLHRRERWLSRCVDVAATMDVNRMTARSDNGGSCIVRVRGQSQHCSTTRQRALSDDVRHPSSRLA